MRAVAANALAELLFDEAGSGLLVTLRDVTAAATASESTVEEARFRGDARALAVSRNMRDQLVLLEAVRGPNCEIVDWRYVDANEGALELLALTREGLADTGQTLAVLELEGHRAHVATDGRQGSRWPAS